MQLPKAHALVMQPFMDVYALTVNTEPVLSNTGKAISTFVKTVDIKGIFIPMSHKLISGKTGDLIAVDAELQVTKYALDSAGITAATLITRVSQGNRNFTVMEYRDYTDITGCYVFELQAEVEETAH